MVPGEESVALLGGLVDQGCVADRLAARLTVTFAHADDLPARAAKGGGIGWAARARSMKNRTSSMIKLRVPSAA